MAARSEHVEKVTTVRDGVRQHQIHIKGDMNGTMVAQQESAKLANILKHRSDW